MSKDEDLIQRMTKIKWWDKWIMKMKWMGNAVTLICKSEGKSTVTQDNTSLRTSLIKVLKVEKLTMEILFC